jgi:pimeloyl-ACP methyl ester carboxylesterase
MMKQLTSFVLGLAMVAATPAGADTFVLVHGAFQTSAAWADVATRLQAAGHTVVAVDLPGRDGDGRAPGEVTMADHVAAVIAAMDTVPGKVTLVGHSFGGMVISAVGEAVPERIDELVYVAAYLPAVGTPGQSMQELSMMDHHGAWQADSFVVAADYSVASVNPRDRVALFANDAGDAAQGIADAMVDEPLPPIATPVALTEVAFGSLRKAYIVTLQDQAVSTAFQLTMLGRGDVDEAIPINTGHVPQLVNPDGLAAALMAAATPELE